MPFKQINLHFISVTLCSLSKDELEASASTRPHCIFKTLTSVLLATTAIHVMDGFEASWSKQGAVEMLNANRPTDKEVEQECESVSSPSLLRPQNLQAEEAGLRPGCQKVPGPEAARLFLKVSAAYDNEHRKVTIVVFC